MLEMDTFEEINSVKLKSTHLFEKLILDGVMFAIKIESKLFIAANLKF